MPNNGRLTLCPYYRDEKNLSISCEDVFRRFRWGSQKKRWLDEYCDKNWQNCPHAKELGELYERMEDNVNNTDKTILGQEHKIRALEKELRKTASMLGRAEARERKKDGEIKQLRHENRVLEQLYFKNKDLVEEKQKKYEGLREDFKELSRAYEAEHAYLIWKNGGYLDLEAYHAWTHEYEYAIVPQIEDNTILGIGVKVRRIEDEHEPRGHAAEDARTGGGKIGGAERQEENSGSPTE